MIHNFSEFCTELLKSGFTVSSGNNDEDVFSLLTPNFCNHSVVSWHTGNPDTDPWEWRTRALDERNDIAYSKVFFRKAGYITKKWYPYFLAVRRSGRSFKEAYSDGLFSQYTKRIFETLLENGPLPLHEIKLYGNFGKDDKSRFDKALTDLQMGLFITMCGRQQKRSKAGEEYGWASTMFCTTEEFWPSEIFEKAAGVSTDDAENKITEQVYKFNPNADAKKIKKFIYGR